MVFIDIKMPFMDGLSVIEAARAQGIKAEFVIVSAYADFDFRNEKFNELQVWEVPAWICIEAADTFTELLTKETAFFGRQPELPEWVYNGLIVGVQGGNERSFGLMED